MGVVKDTIVRVSPVKKMHRNDPFNQGSQREFGTRDPDLWSPAQAYW